MKTLQVRQLNFPRPESHNSYRTNCPQKNYNTTKMTTVYKPRGNFVQKFLKPKKKALNEL